ncbi:MAG: hypothetical protein M1838_006160 [Thelocarpon superellum]|nr:MAG: hypothetical protein M1838_006160 [Thelocarpon superellum]
MHLPTKPLPVATPGQVRSPSPPLSLVLSEKSKDLAYDDEEKSVLSLDAEPSSSPDGGYGWVCVACCFLIDAHSWGINSSYGVFLAYYLSNNTFAGATYLDYAFIGGLSYSQCLMVSPVANTITRLWGTRTTLFVGVFFETLALFGASFATEKWHLFLTQGLCLGWGIGFQHVGSAGIISQWFHERRSLANGIGNAGSGFGGLVYSLAAGAMITTLGLAWTFRILALVQLVVNSVCALLIKDRNEHIGTTVRAFDYRLLAKPEFWLVLGWSVFSMLGYIVLLFSLPDYARSIGLTAQQGSIIGALLNLSQGIGRPVVGYFSDSAGRLNIAGFTTMACAVVCFGMWIFASSFEILIAFALVVGTICGVFWAAVGPVVSEVLELKDLSSGLSIVWLAIVLPTTFAEPFALELRQVTGGNFFSVKIFAGCMYVCAAVCMWLLRAWKVAQVQELEEASQASLSGRTSPASLASGRQSPTSTISADSKRGASRSPARSFSRSPAGSFISGRTTPLSRRLVMSIKV